MNFRRKRSINLFETSFFVSFTELNLMCAEFFKNKVLSVAKEAKQMSYTVTITVFLLETALCILQFLDFS